MSLKTASAESTMTKREILSRNYDLDLSSSWQDVIAYDMVAQRIRLPFESMPTFSQAIIAGGIFQTPGSNFISLDSSCPETPLLANLEQTGDCCGARLYRIKSAPLNSRSSNLVSKSAFLDRN